MFRMSHIRRRLAILGFVALSLPALTLEDGTTAGTNVQNRFTLNYKVSGVDQNTIDAGVSGSKTPTGLNLKQSR